MAEFDRARVWSLIYRGPFRFSVLAANTSTTIGGTQRMLKTPVAIASVQVTRASMRIVSFIETGRAVSCFVVFLRWSKTIKTRKWKKKILKSPKEKIKNPKDNTKEEAGGIIKDNTEARIGMDHDTMSITLRWLDWIFWGWYLPTLSINYVGMSKDIYFVFTSERPHYSLALFSSFIYTCTFSKKIEFA